MDQIGKTLMDEALKAIETEKVISQKKPYPRPSKNYAEVLQRHQYTKAHQEQMATKNKQQHGFKLNQVTAPKHCSIKKIDDLQPILLKDMLVNQVHHGSYLLCRTVGDPFYMTAMSILVEDENGEIENVSIYNYTTSYEISPYEFSPPNTVIKIKEPYLKIMISNNDDYYIRIESPTDIVFVDDNHGVDKWLIVTPEMTYEQLNDLGNKFFVSKEYRKAIKQYDRALKKDATNAKTYCNRAAAYLELEMFYQAMEDAQESARLEPSEKAYYRLGKAAYSMRQYEMAAESFKKCLALNEKNRKAADDLKRCHDRIEESKTGCYDVKALINNVKSGVLRLDVGDYVSKDIEIVDIPNKSKGIVALNDIKRGTLLVGSKAASIAYDSECHVKVFSINFYTKKIDQASNNQNLANLFFKLQHDPYLAEQVYGLFPGSDIDRNHKIPALIVDSSRVDCILTYNSFITQDEKEFMGTSARDEMEENSGLWIYPAYFNHSCIPNTVRIYLKDFVMFYAFKDIKKGEELTTQYGGLSSYEEREKVCDHFGFKCACKLCELDRNDKKYAARELLLAKNSQILQNLDSANLKYLMKYIQMVKDTYVDRSELQIRLSLPLGTLAGFFRLKGDSKRAAEQFMEMFNLLKDYDVMFASMLIIQVINNYLEGSMIKEAKVALQIAKGYFVGPVEYYNHVYGINDFHLPDDS